MARSQVSEACRLLPRHGPDNGCRVASATELHPYTGTHQREAVYGQESPEEHWTPGECSDFDLQYRLQQRVRQQCGRHK